MSMETDAYVPGMSIYVPISGTDEAVAVKVDDLPDVADLLGLLQAEPAPLGLWRDLAKAYLQRGMEEQFIEIMRTGCSEGACATLRTRAIPAPRAWIARRNPGQIALALVPIAPLIDRSRPAPHRAPPPPSALPFLLPLSSQRSRTSTRTRRTNACPSSARSRRTT